MGVCRAGLSAHQQAMCYLLLAISDENTSSSVSDQQTPLAARIAQYNSPTETRALGLIEAATQVNAQDPTVQAFFSNWLHSLLDSKGEKVRHKPSTNTLALARIHCAAILQQ